MKCPQCGKDLGSDLLPARCPDCGANLRDPALVSGSRDAGASRRSVEGLTGIGKGSTKDRGRHRVQLALAVLIVAVFCVGVVWMVRWAQGTLSRVPDVVGWRYERAEKELDKSDEDDGWEEDMDDEEPITPGSDDSEVSLSQLQDDELDDMDDDEEPPIDDFEELDEDDLLGFDEDDEEDFEDED